MKSSPGAPRRRTACRGSAADARRIFGFEQPRGANGKRVTKLRQGIPSESSLCRHRKRFGERRRRGAYERLFKRLVREHLLEFSEFREEARLLGIDGTKIETHYQCPKIDPETKKVVNAEKVTCLDGGFVGQQAGADKSGHGFNGIFLTTFSGLPLGSMITPLHESEPRAALEAIKDFKRDVVPHLEQDELHVLAADGAYHAHTVRKALHECGIIERVHRVSHGDSKKSRENAARHDRLRFLIDGYPNWAANGHYEIFCKCGEGRTWKEISKRGGKAVVRTGGDCKTCGRISITAGTWRKVQNVGGRRGQNGFVRCMPGEHDRADLAFGNPLTFHDPIAEIYGNRRFGNCEGLNGALESRFKVNKGKRWFRRGDQAREDVAIVFSIIHALAMEQRRRAARSGAPPGQAEAA